jgi:hypothetical protein
VGARIVVIGGALSFGLGAATGRIGGGLFVDRLNSRLADASNFLLQAGALGLLLVVAPTALSSTSPAACSGSPSAT